MTSIKQEKMAKVVLATISTLIVFLFMGNQLLAEDATTNCWNPCDPCDSCCEEPEPCPDPEPCPTPEPCPNPEPCPDPTPCPDPPECNCPPCDNQDVVYQDCPDGGCCTVNVTFSRPGETTIQKLWREVPTLDDTLIFPDGEYFVDRVIWRMKAKPHAVIYYHDVAGKEMIAEAEPESAEEKSGGCDTEIDFYVNDVYRTTYRWCEVPKKGEELWVNPRCTIDAVKWQIGDHAKAEVYCSDGQAPLLKEDEKEQGGICFINTLMN